MVQRPSVLLFISHDTGRFISPYGVETVHTPNLERLAAESVLFRRAFCTAPQCSPSRAALVTGRYPHCNGVMGLTHQDYAWALNPTERPAAKLFGANGYPTWLLGIQHETRDVYSLGFEHVDLGFGVAELPARLEAALEGRDPSQPFYCQLGCFETHRPWTMPGIPPDSSLGVTVPAYLHDGPESRAEMAALQGSVLHLDEGVGALLEVLERHDQRENTVLVVTTDHGLALPMAKSTLRDPGIETLLLMRYPDGGWPQGERIEDLVSNVDILPTLLEACSLDVPEAVQGASFLPLLQGKGTPTRDAVFAEKTFHDCYDPMRAVRTEKFKYIRYFEKSTHHPVPGDIVDGGAHRELGSVPRFGSEELYDLERDPNETRNLADDEAYGDVCREMRARLAGWMCSTADPLLEGPVGSPFYQASVEGLLDSRRDRG
jgi:N-sulfoglucosamine sulfohydrolase